MQRRTQMSRTKPSVASIPDRVALANERLYTRARLLALAKQHNISTAKKSRSQIIDDLVQHSKRSFEAEVQVIQPSIKAADTPTTVLGMFPVEASMPQTPDKKSISSATPACGRAQPLRVRKQISVELSPTLPGYSRIKTPVRSLGDIQSAVDTSRVDGKDFYPGSSENRHSLSPKKGTFLYHRLHFTAALKGLYYPGPAHPSHRASGRAVTTRGAFYADSSPTAEILAHRAVRRKNSARHFRGARRVATLEPLSEEEEKDKISPMTHELHFLGHSSPEPLSAADLTNISADLAKHDPSHLMKEPDNLYVPWNGYNYDIEEEDEVEVECDIESSPERRTNKAQQLWTSTGGLNLDAVQSIVKGGWIFDDITERLMSSDFR